MRAQAAMNCHDLYFLSALYRGRDTPQMRTGAAEAAMSKNLSLGKQP